MAASAPCPPKSKEISDGRNRKMAGQPASGPRRPNHGVGRAGGGVTIPTVQLPAVSEPGYTVPGQQIPSVSVGQISVGPFSVGPYSTPGGNTPAVTVPPDTVGGGNSPGGTVGQYSNDDVVTAAGAAACTGIDITDPSQANMMSGTTHIAVLLEVLDLATNTTVFLTWQPQSASMTDVPVACIPQYYPELLGQGVQSSLPYPFCPNGVPAVGGDLAAGQQEVNWQGVPAAGQVFSDPSTGVQYESLGVGEIYFGAEVAASGVSAGQGSTCQFGDYVCDTSATFPIE